MLIQTQLLSKLEGKGILGEATRNSFCRRRSDSVFMILKGDSCIEKNIFDGL